jgi:3-oxoacyl-[acyl-carrier protein] reductase
MSDDGAQFPVLGLSGRVAIVTGASRGIGRAVALKLAALGAKVVINYNSHPEAAEAVVEQIRAAGGEAVSVSANVSEPAAAQELVNEALTVYYRVDILVNNAGVLRDNLLMRMSEQDWDLVLDTNLKGAFNCLKSVTKPMLKQRYGRVVNIASVSGLAGNAGQVNYSAAKAGLLGLTKSAAKELGSRNITVNAVAPGFIETDMTSELAEDWKKMVVTLTPLGRMGRPEDVAQAVAFFVSDEAAFITGQVLSVDGGFVMQ